MEKLLIVNSTERTDVLIKIMVARIGINRSIYIEKNTFSEICFSIKRYQFETGGIIGTNSKGIINSFQFDSIRNPTLYEYYPNIPFLSNIINNEWIKSDVWFKGFVHSHLHNAGLSKQDISYAREIINANDFLDEILIGVINLSTKEDLIKWYMIDMESVFELNVSFVKGEIYECL